MEAGAFRLGGCVTAALPVKMGPMSTIAPTLFLVLLLSQSRRKKSPKRVAIAIIAQKDGINVLGS